MNELQAAKQEALLLYIDGTLSDSEISKHLNIEQSTLKQWVQKEDWDTKRNEAESNIITRANAQFKKHIAKRRLETAQRHLHVATMIEQQIQKRIEEAESPTGTSKLAGIPISTRELKDMSQALKLSADTSARAVVLTERESEYNGHFGGSDDGVKRLINVNIMPIGPAGSTKPEINITSEVVVNKPKPKPISDDPF